MKNQGRLHNDGLTSSQKVGIVAGNFLLTPLLGAVLYYLWRKEYPNCAKFANRTAWLSFFAIVLSSILWNAVVMPLVVNALGTGTGTVRKSELATIAQEDRPAMEKLYDGIQVFETNDDKRVTAIVYMPFNPLFNFDDSVASELKSLSKLEILRLPMVSNLSDRGLGQLCQLAELKQLSISGAENCTDEGLQLLSQLQNLEQLGLAMTGIGRMGLSSIGKLERLEFLDLTATEVGDDDIQLLGGLAALKSISLVGTRVTDEALKTIAQLPALEQLDIRGCNVGDKGLEYLSNSMSIKRLDAFKTKSGGGKITDNGVDYLSRLKTLQIANLQGNKISDAAVEAMKKVLPNCVVETGTQN